MQAVKYAVYQQLFDIYVSLNQSHTQNRPTVTCRHVATVFLCAKYCEMHQLLLLTVANVATATLVFRLVLDRGQLCCKVMDCSMTTQTDLFSLAQHTDWQQGEAASLATTPAAHLNAFLPACSTIKDLAASLSVCASLQEDHLSDGQLLLRQPPSSISNQSVLLMSPQSRCQLAAAGETDRQRGRETDGVMKRVINKGKFLSSGEPRPPGGRH